MESRTLYAQGFPRSQVFETLLQRDQGGSLLRAVPCFSGVAEGAWEGLPGKTHLGGVESALRGSAGRAWEQQDLQGAQCWEADLQSPFPAPDM